MLVARDLLARRSELAALRVADITPAAPAAAATVLIARGKIDQDGQGAVRYSAPRRTRRCGRGSRRPGSADGPLFRSVHVTGRVGAALHPQKISEIFRKLASARRPALDDARRSSPTRISGHSARVGMAQDLLVAAGFELGAIMQAGRWNSPAMVARYTEALAAEDRAVAQFHAGVEKAGRADRRSGPRAQHREGAA